MASLPKELQVIIDDISSQNIHLLEWEVFGNLQEDMRAVLTWRKIEGSAVGDQGSRWTLRERTVQKEHNNHLEERNDYVEDYWISGWAWAEEQDRLRRIEEERIRAEEERKRKEEEERRRIEEEKRRKEEEERLRLEEEKRRKEEEERRIAEEIRRLEEERRRKEEEERKRKEEEERKRQEEERLRREEEERKRAEEERLRQLELARIQAEEDERKRLAEIERLRLEEMERKRREAEEIDLNARIYHTPEQAKGMLQRQRTRMNVAVNQAELEEAELNKRFPEGVIATIFGSDWDPNCMTSEYAKEHRVFGNDEMGAYCDPDEGYKVGGAGGAEGEDGKAGGEEGGENDEEDEEGKKRKKGGMGELDEERRRKLQFYDPNIFRGLDGTVDVSDPRMRWYWYPGYYPGMYLGLGPSQYKGSGFQGFHYDPKTMGTGYEVEYLGTVYRSRRVKKRKMRGEKVRDRRHARPVYRKISPYTGSKARESCVDCKYNDFCDSWRCKDEYWHMLYQDSLTEQPDEIPDCDCTICTGSAVHNGCFFRELLRLKSEYLTFDKHNYCYCSVCIPFKYRRMCLRQEFKLFKKSGEDHYYRLTDNTGDDGVIRFQISWDSEDSDAEDKPGYGFMEAIAISDIKLTLTKDDKISYRDCPDCQCNGFCDNIRHKKIYMMLLRIDDVDFDELEDDCWCLVCEFGGAAHSGCAEREIRRLKYDLRLFDVRNLCYCNQCVPFKYRKKCLRQELKEKRRKRGIDMYHHIYN